MAVELLKTGQGWVPIVNGCLLHSSVRPALEAQKFLDRELMGAKAIHAIVLGLGGGFHVEELLNRKFRQVVVIESNRELVELLRNKIPRVFEQTEILCAPEPESILDLEAIQEVASEPFVIIKHPTCFKQDPYYYNLILDQLNSRNSTSLKKLCSKRPELSKILNSIGDEEDLTCLPNVFEEVTKEALIFNTLKELIK